MYGAFLPASASGPTTAPGPAPGPAPALAPGAALAPAVAAAAEAAPSSAMLPRMLLASPAGQPSPPVVQPSTAQLKEAAPAITRDMASPTKVAPGPNAAQLSALADVAGARADASTTPLAGDGGKHGGGLGAKSTGIVAGVVGAGAVVLSKCCLPARLLNGSISV